MGEIKLDHIDAAIIQLLQQDGRMPAVEIAKRIPGGTARMVRYRIERLTREGIITVTAVVHPKPLGYTVMADVMIEVEPGKTHHILAHLAEADLVTYAGGSTGDRDISIQVVHRSVDALYDFVVNDIQHVPGVRQTRTYLLPVALKFTYNWSLPKEAYDSGGAMDGAVAQGDGNEA